MAKKLRKHAIFFEDLSEKAQARLIEDEMRVSLHRQFAVRYVYVEKDLYGYDPDPKKQTLEQYIHAKLVDDDDLSRKSAPWLLVWNCLDKDFTTIMKEEQEDTSYKEQLELSGIAVDYTEGETKIVLNFKTAEDRFGMNLKVDVPENMTEEEKKSGHGGMDGIMLRQFIDRCRSGEPFALDVYDAASWMAITVLSEQSISLGGAPVSIPDFTNGQWMHRERLDVM